MQADNDKMATMTASFEPSTTDIENNESQAALTQLLRSRLSCFPTTSVSNLYPYSIIRRPSQKSSRPPPESEVTQAVHRLVESCAKQAISRRGHFALAIPGGSVLKVLSSLDPLDDWVSKTTLCFVNHKCVDITEESSAIEAQARAKFLDRWGLTDIISLNGSSDGKKG